MHDNATTTAIYRSMDRAALDAAYNNSAAVSDSPKWLENWRARSATVQARHGVRLAIPYAPRERTKIDYFPAGVRNAPLFVFIHGGYWIRNSREMFSFLADGPNAHGIDVVVIGYTLAPEARLSQIVDEVSQCLTFLAKQSAQFGFNDDRIFVGGWSAGGHLSAMACEHPAVRGALPISGIFDLEPVSMNYLNDPLQLSRPDIERLSPLRRLRSGGPPQRLVFGGNELSELQRQSRDYVAAANALNIDFTARMLPGHHHFSILDELAKPDGLITAELLGLISDAAARLEKASVE